MRTTPPSLRVDSGEIQLTAAAMRPTFGHLRSLVRHVENFGVSTDCPPAARSPGAATKMKRRRDWANARRASVDATADAIKSQRLSTKASRDASHDRADTACARTDAVDARTTTLNASRVSIHTRTPTVHE